MGSFGYYLIKDLYIGKILRVNPYTTNEEEITVDYWAFEKSIDKNTGAPKYTPLKEKTGYYYIEEMNPLINYLNGKGKVIKKDVLDRVVNKIKTGDSKTKVLKLKDINEAA